MSNEPKTSPPPPSVPSIKALDKLRAAVNRARYRGIDGQGPVTDRYGWPMSGDDMQAITGAALELVLAAPPLSVPGAGDGGRYANQPAPASAGGVPFTRDRDATCDWNCAKVFPHDGPCGPAEPSAGSPPDAWHCQFCGYGEWKNRADWPKRQTDHEADCNRRPPSRPSSTEDEPFNVGLAFLLEACALPPAEGSLPASAEPEKEQEHDAGLLGNTAPCDPSRPPSTPSDREV